MILMRNPTTGAVARATERAFTLAHEPKGWVKVDPTKVKKDDLLEAAESLGVPVKASATREKIASTLAGDTN